MIKNRLGPAATSAKHVAERETAAGDDALHTRSRSIPALDTDRSCGRHNASKPARMKADAISYWLLTPCSRRIATRGFAPPTNGAAMSSSRIERQRLTSQARIVPLHECAANSSSRRRRIVAQATACDSSAPTRSRCSARTVESQHEYLVVTVDRQFVVRLRPGRARPSPRRTILEDLGSASSWRLSATWMTAPSSSLNNCLPARPRADPASQETGSEASREHHLADASPAAPPSERSW